MRALYTQPRYFFFLGAGAGISQSSVRNGIAGKPSLFNKLGNANLFQAKRTATGLEILSAETTTVTILPCMYTTSMFVEEINNGNIIQILNNRRIYRKDPKSRIRGKKFLYKFNYIYIKWISKQQTITSQQNSMKRPISSIKSCLSRMIVHKLPINVLYQYWTWWINMLKINGSLNSSRNHWMRSFPSITDSLPSIFTKSTSTTKERNN